MKTRTVEAAITIAFISLICAACASTGGNSIAASNYRCQDLKQLVVERDQVFLSGFLGTKSSVYASAGSCDTVLENAVPSAWRTSDVFACVVGYRCEEVIGKEEFSGGVQ